jgi:N-acetylmuramoyl-L-alanine amidase
VRDGKRVLLIDPGHGGKVRPEDPPPVRDARLGATWPLVKGSDTYEMVEKEISLGMAWKLRAAIMASTLPVHVEMTRTDDTPVAMSVRGGLSKAVGADLVISLHVNSHPDPKNQGLMTFCRAGDFLGKAVAEDIARCAPPALQRKRNATFVCDPKEAWLDRPRHVLEVHECPAVLVEMFHITNEADRLEWGLGSVQDDVVAACVAGAARAVGVA